MVVLLWEKLLEEDAAMWLLILSNYFKVVFVENHTRIVNGYHTLYNIYLIAMWFLNMVSKFMKPKQVFGQKFWFGSGEDLKLEGWVTSRDIIQKNC